MLKTATKTGRQIVDDAYAALFERGDLEGFLADFDDQTIMLEADSLPYGGTFHGKDAIRSAIQGVFGYWKDFAYKIDEITYGENYVIAYGQFSATSIKTGKSVDFPLAEVWKIIDGRIVMIHPVYGDTKAAVDALG